MTVVLQIDGMDTLQMFLKNVSPRVTTFLTGAITETIFEVFAESQVEVPVDTSTLKNTGHVSEPDISPGSIEIAIGYGTDYATLVHENLMMKHTPPTKAKFLEDPMNDALDKLTYRAAGRMEAAMVGEYAAGQSLPTMQTTANIRGGTDLRARHNVAHAHNVLAAARGARASNRSNYRPFKASGGVGPHNRGTGGGGGKA